MQLALFVTVAASILLFVEAGQGDVSVIAAAVVLCLIDCVVLY